MEGSEGPCVVDEEDVDDVTVGEVAQSGARAWLVAHGAEGTIEDAEAAWLEPPDMGCMATLERAGKELLGGGLP